MGRKDAINSSLDVIVAAAAEAAGRAGRRTSGAGRREWWCFTSHNYDYPPCSVGALALVTRLRESPFGRHLIAIIQSPFSSR